MFVSPTRLYIPYVYISFHHRTLTGLPHDESPTLEPGTSSRISARFMAPGHETPRARRGGCSSGGGPQSAPFWRRVRRALAPRRFAGNPRRSLFGGWALPERNMNIRTTRSTAVEPRRAVLPHESGRPTRAAQLQQDNPQMINSGYID